MGDLLVRLYDLPPLDLASMHAAGITVRRAIAPERNRVRDWVDARFNPIWVSEVEVAFGHQPIGVFIATRDHRLLGFSCADATARGFFGPTGVDEAERGKGVGEALLLVALHDLRAQGYAYGVIGDPGPMAFYTKRLDTLEIPNSKPGFYSGMLRGE